MSLISLRAAAVALGLCLLLRRLPAKAGPTALLAGSLLFLAGTPVALALHAGHTALTLLLAIPLRRRQGRGRALLWAAVLLECALIPLLRRWGGFSCAALVHIGYLLDARRGGADAPLAARAAALTYFPSLREGPIVDASALAGRLLAPEPLTWERGSRALLRVVTGLAKKLIVADRLAGFVEAAFAAPGACCAGVLWLALLAYGMQIYMDFSGCMDVALGLSALLGVDLPENFSRPYFAAGCAEYWRRWHITLGGWFRSRCFYPLAASRPALALGGRLAKRCGGVRLRRACAMALPLLATWALVGLWHGFAPHYLAWGLVNGLAILAGTALESGKPTLPRGLRVARTFFIISLIRVLFRAGSLKDSGAFYAGLLGFGGAGGWLLLPAAADIAVAALFAALFMALEWRAERHGEARPSVPAALALCALGIAAVCILGRYGPGYDPVAFYYNRF